MGLHSQCTKMNEAANQIVASLRVKAHAIVATYTHKQIRATFANEAAVALPPRAATALQRLDAGLLDMPPEHRAAAASPLGGFRTAAVTSSAVQTRFCLGLLASLKIILTATSLSWLAHERSRPLKATGLYGLARERSHPL